MSTLLFPAATTTIEGYSPIEQIKSPFFDVPIHLSRSESPNELPISDRRVFSFSFIIIKDRFLFYDRDRWQINGSFLSNLLEILSIWYLKNRFPNAKSYYFKLKLISRCPIIFTAAVVSFLRGGRSKAVQEIIR